ncbi:hypothetical protein [Dolichospermum flos-aquae]|uniref:Uncharacterized protein n=1 Tax=Dolichospermum flos-aquae LEGE 04289 TaxID=1828708 RepID=A0ACC5Q210_DOLFA|nr:hypothetical protein [Dolichospermum flos-aquae]MBE9218687.1 hypothetical protein [Dolichospermum flos-aquae LEGE 04289]
MQKGGVKKNLIDHVLDLITLEVDMKIQFVVPVSLLILVSGSFIDVKNWQSYTSAIDIEKSLCSKTFHDDENCPVIVLEPETSYAFSAIKPLVPVVVDDVIDEKTKPNQIPNNVNKNGQEISRTQLRRKNRRTYTRRGPRKVRKSFNRKYRP